MDLTEPTRSLGPSLHLTVLAVLSRTEQPLSGRGIARLLDGKASQRGVADALTYLVQQGLVLREDHPPAAAFQLNRDHIAASIVEKLGVLRETLRQRCAAEIESWDVQPVWASLFGSFVRGEGNPGSDIDLAVVIPDDTGVPVEHWETDIDRLAVHIHAWTGNPASIITFRDSEFALSEEPVAAEILRDGLTVAGDRPSA